MARIKKLQIRLTEQEFDVLARYAIGQGVSMSEVIRDYVKSLMQPTKVQSSPDLLPHQQPTPS